MMDADINKIREGVAEFAQRAGISQVEAACEICLVLTNALVWLEKGLSFEEAVNTVTDAFEERWGKAFET